MKFKILIISIALFFSGCAQLILKEKQKIVFNNPGTIVKETEDSFIQDLKETPFFASTNNFNLAGALVFKEGNKNANGVINLITNKENNQTKIGRWDIYSCDSNATEIKGVPFSDNHNRKINISFPSNKEYQQILKEMNKESFIFIPNQCLYIMSE